ncbi:hypothetical protein ACXJJ3_08405 [Kribbella sp. WER1]
MNGTEPPAWAVKARPIVDVAGRILCLVLGGAPHAELPHRAPPRDGAESPRTTDTELRESDLTALRGQILDRILQRVANAAAVEKFDKDEVADLFRSGSPVVRVIALGLMEGDRSLIDSAILLDAINGPLTGNEQFHALKLVRGGWGRLMPEERNQLVAALDHNPQLQEGPDRIAMAQQIRELGANSRIG